MKKSKSKRRDALPQCRKPPSFRRGRKSQCYLPKGGRTVQRWEHEYGLPVRRCANGAKKSGVIAAPREIDAWVQARPFQNDANIRTDLDGSSVRELIASLRAENERLRTENLSLRSRLVIGANSKSN